MDRGGPSATRVVPTNHATYDATTDAVVASPPSESTTVTVPKIYPGCEHPEVEAKCADGWCEIPPGCYTAGSPFEEPSRGRDIEWHRPVTLTRGFMIQRHEMTQVEWLGDGYPQLSRAPSEFDPAAYDCIADDCPATGMSWMDIVTYANKRSEAEGLTACYELIDCRGTVAQDLWCLNSQITTATIYDCDGYRLPTHAEWEYAARAGTHTPYYSGEMTIVPRDIHCARDPNLERIAWYCDNAGLITHPVGQKEPNGWGLYDLIGNVAERVNDLGRGGAPDVPQVDPDRSGSTNEAGSISQWRDTRGCGLTSWGYICRVAGGLGAEWNHGNSGVGFRLVRTISRSPSSPW